MGMPMYGQGFTLANPSENGLNAPAAGPSQAGEFTRANGFLSYYEVNICIEKKSSLIVLITKFNSFPPTDMSKSKK